MKVSCLVLAILLTASNARAARVWVVGDLEKVHPVSGALLNTAWDTFIPDERCKKSNFHWDSASRSVRLEGARGEVLGFQVIVERSRGERLTGLHLSPSDLRGPALIDAGGHFEVFRTFYLKGGLPEVLVPLAKARDWDHFPLPDPERLGFENNNQSLWVDLFVPYGAPAGVYTGTLVLEADQFGLPDTLNLRLEVWPLTLPKEQNYDIELNEYGTLYNNFSWSAGYTPWDRNFDWRAFNGAVSAARREDYLAFERNAYRLCQQNRLSLNILPYFQTGAPSTIVPESMLPLLAGGGDSLRVSDWTEFDRRWGPLFDGTAFEGNWRSGVPLAHHYLPVCHGLPSDFQNFVADQTDPPYWGRNPVYEAENLAFDRAFESHANACGWTRTTFQVYYNEKANKAKNDIIWHLDEPEDTSIGLTYPPETRWYDYTWGGVTKKILRGRYDFEALKYFSRLMHQGFTNTLRPAERLGDPEYRAAFPNPAAARFVFRLDLGSQNMPEIRRGVLDGWIDQWNVGHFTEIDLCRARVARGDIYTNYRYWDATAGINACYYAISAWTNYADGASGHTLWFCDDAWEKLRDNWASGTGPNTLIYPGSTIGLDEPLAGFRIKALRHGAQDFEYLLLLKAAAPGEDMKLLRTLTSGADFQPGEEFSRSGLSPEKMYAAHRRLARTLLGVAGSSGGAR